MVKAQVGIFGAVGKWGAVPTQDRCNWHSEDEEEEEDPAAEVVLGFVLVVADRYHQESLHLQNSAYGTAPYQRSRQ